MNGRVKVQMQTNDLDNATMEIVKDTESHYYSPFRKKIKLSSSEPVDVYAVLYSIPKPAFDISDRTEEVGGVLQFDAELENGVDISDQEVNKEEKLSVNSDVASVETNTQGSKYVL